MLGGERSGLRSKASDMHVLLPGGGGVSGGSSFHWRPLWPLLQTSAWVGKL